MRVHVVLVLIISRCYHGETTMSRQKHDAQAAAGPFARTSTHVYDCRRYDKYLFIRQIQIAKKNSCIFESFLIMKISTLYIFRALAVTVPIRPRRANSNTAIFTDLEQRVALYGWAC